MEILKNTTQILHLALGRCRMLEIIVGVRSKLQFNKMLYANLQIKIAATSLKINLIDHNNLEI